MLKNTRENNMLNMHNARTERQLAKMIECQELGICPFCSENFSKYHDAPILKEGKFWFLTENDDPYPGSTRHIMAINKRHILSILDLGPGEGDELIYLFKWALTEELRTPGATFWVRFGDMEYTGASVDHLHAHLAVGLKRSENTEPLRAKIGWKTRKMKDPK